MKIIIACLLALSSFPAMAGSITITLPAGSTIISGKFTTNADGSITIASPMLNYKGVLYYINADGDYRSNTYGVCTWVGKKAPGTPTMAKTGATSLMLTSVGAPASVNAVTGYTIGSITCS